MILTAALTYRVLLEPLVCYVDLVVSDGHAVTHTQHSQQVQVAVVLASKGEWNTAYPVRNNGSQNNRVLNCSYGRESVESYIGISVQDNVVTAELQ